VFIIPQGRTYQRIHFKPKGDVRRNLQLNAEFWLAGDVKGTSGNERQGLNRRDDQRDRRGSAYQENEEIAGKIFSFTPIVVRIG